MAILISQDKCVCVCVCTQSVRITAKSIDVIQDSFAFS